MYVCLAGGCLGERCILIVLPICSVHGPVLWLYDKASSVWRHVETPSGGPRESTVAMRTTVIHHSDSGTIPTQGYRTDLSNTGVASCLIRPTGTDKPDEHGGTE
jgi:hypothetical protein